MFELLLAFAFWPWLFVVALAGVLLFSAFSDTLGLAILAFAAFSGLSWGFYDAGPIPFLIESPWRFVGLVFAYGLIGVLWSLFKWRRWLLSPDLQSQMADAKISHSKSVHQKPDDYRKSSFFPSAAKPSYNQERISSWVALWPLSMLLYVAGDLLASALRKIYKLFAGVYQRMADNLAP